MLVFGLLLRDIFLVLLQVNCFCIKDFCYGIAEAVMGSGLGSHRLVEWGYMMVSVMAVK